MTSNQQLTREILSLENELLSLLPNTYTSNNTHQTNAIRNLISTIFEILNLQIKTSNSSSSDDGDKGDNTKLIDEFESESLTKANSLLLSISELINTEQFQLQEQQQQQQQQQQRLYIKKDTRNNKQMSRDHDDEFEWF